MHPTIDNFDFSQLSVDDRLALIGRIWDSIDPENESIPIPTWHRELLRERLAHDEENPASRVTWDELKRQLRDE